MDFENYKDRYLEEVQKAISFIRQDFSFFMETKAQCLLNLVRKYFEESKGLDVLDVGCGIGLTDRYLTSHFRSLHGVDLGEGIIAKAKEKNPAGIYQVYNGEKLPYPDEAFDVVFTICVIQCVPPNILQNFVKELRRVTKKGGVVIVFEHNPLNPLTILAARRFDPEFVPLSYRKLQGLFQENGLSIREKGYIIFFPWRGKIFHWIEERIAWLPFGAQYYAVARPV